jgi:hypothetical protein
VKVGANRTGLRTIAPRLRGAQLPTNGQPGSRPSPQVPSTADDADGADAKASFRFGRSGLSVIWGGVLPTELSLAIITRLGTGTPRERRVHRHHHLSAAGVQVEQALFVNPSALQKLKSGELAALVRVIGRPIDFFARIPANSGLHFVPIPFSKTFADYYTLGELTGKEYPNLVPEGQSVDTIGVPAVLAVYNWSKGGDRYRRVERFTEAFFPSGTSFASLRAIRNGVTAIWRRPFPVRPAGGSRTRCCGVFVQRTWRTRR